MSDVTLNAATLMAAIASLSGAIAYLFRLIHAGHQEEIKRIVASCDEEIARIVLAKDEHLKREREASDYYRTIVFEVLRKAEGAVQIADRATSIAARRNDVP